MRTNLYPFVWALILLCGCGLDDHSNDSTRTVQSSRDRQLAAFKTTLHPVVQNRCGSCHGASQSPMFAVGDSTSAFDTTMNNSLVSMAAVPSSRLVIKSAMAHGGCPTCNPATSDDIKSAILAWVEASKAPGGDPPTPTPVPVGNRLVTDAKAAPDNLPTGATFASMSWSLDALGFPGAVISVEIQRFGDPNPTDYRFRRPRLLAGAQALRIKDIALVVNGTVEPAASTYKAVDGGSAANQATSLSATAMVVVDANGATPDTFALSIGQLTASAPADCATLAAFSANVQPVLQNTCMGCHGAGGAGAGAFDMSGADADRCRQARLRSRGAASSVFVSVPFLPLWSHTSQLTQANAVIFSNWIRGEWGN